MTHIPNPLPTHTDPVAAAIAEAILQRLNIDALAARIADHIRNTHPAENQTYDPAEPYPVTECRRQLGTRGRPCAYQTFQKRYIDTGILTLIPGPKRSHLYVRRGDWEIIKRQTT